MIVLITTFSTDGPANIGDLLIAESLAEMLRSLGVTDPVTSFFREDRLEPHLDVLNQARAILLPGFAVRDTPMWPVTYRLTEDLDHIHSPLVPVGSNYNIYPGDEVSRRSVRFGTETRAFLERVAASGPAVSCREWHTCEVLERNGVSATTMTGDPAWYVPDLIGQPLRSPTDISRIVFSPPLSPYYADQAVEVMRMIADTFSGAECVCALHLKDGSDADARKTDSGTSAALSPEVAKKNARIRDTASELGFRLLESNGTIELMDEYAECDIHIGYECHAHIGFLRQRRPSVLIHEDARGVGYTYSLGGAGFDGFLRAPGSKPLPPPKRITSGYATTIEEIEIAPARTGVAETIRRYVREELDSGFRRMRSVTDVLDRTYEESMLPFLRSVLS